MYLIPRLRIWLCFVALVKLAGASGTLPKFQRPIHHHHVNNTTPDVESDTNTTDVTERPVEPPGRDRANRPWLECDYIAVANGPHQHRINGVYKIIKKKCYDRPTFEQISGENMIVEQYIYYVSSMWMISPNLCVNMAGISVVDDAGWPHHVTSVWRVFNNHKVWVEDPRLSVQCSFNNSADGLHKEHFRLLLLPVLLLVQMYITS